MSNHLNLFVPYDRLPLHHENQLTRALLIVLSSVPLAHTIWLHLVGPELNLDSAGPMQFRTQTATPMASHLPRSISDGVLRGISVSLGPDTSQPTANVQTSDRQQILDGIIQYGESDVIVIENKIYDGAGLQQASQINTSGAPVVFEGAVRPISWRRLLQSFADLSIEGRVYGSELRILDDFLQYTELYFPQIGPYSTLRRAGKSIPRIVRRLDEIIAKVVGVEEISRQELGFRSLPSRVGGGDRCVEMASLHFQESTNSIALMLYPGDTLTQARALYRRPTAVRSLLALDGWKIDANFHWGQMQNGVAFATGSILTERYIEYWIDRIEGTGQLRREQWNDYWNELEAQQIVSEADKVEFSDAFDKTRHQVATPRPGLECTYLWPLAEAVALDEDGSFVAAAQDVLVKFLAALKEPF